MPPGCGRVVMTQRSIGLTTSSTTEPIGDVPPDQLVLGADAVGVDDDVAPEAAPVPVADRPRASTDTRALPESWNVPSGPSHWNHSRPASSSKSAAIS